MHRPRCIAIYGTSLFMESIKAVLSIVPDIGVIALDRHQPDLISALKEMKADLVILEKDIIDSAVIWSIVQMGLALIELTPHEMTGRIVQSEQRPITTTNELLSIISI